MRMFMLIAVAGVLGALLWHALTAPVRGSGYAWCDYTGSSQTWNTWPFGIRAGLEYHESPIETLIKRKRPTDLQHKWIVYSGPPDRDAFGHPVGTTANRPLSPRSQFTLLPGVLDRWAERATEEQIENLYDVLCREDTGEVAMKLEELKQQWIQWFPPRL